MQYKLAKTLMKLDMMDKDAVEDIYIGLDGVCENFLKTLDALYITTGDAVHPDYIEHGDLLILLMGKSPWG